MRGQGRASYRHVIWRYVITAHLGGTQSAVHSLVEAGHMCVSGLEVGGGGLVPVSAGFLPSHIGTQPVQRTPLSERPVWPHSIDQVGFGLTSEILLPLPPSAGVEGVCTTPSVAFNCKCGLAGMQMGTEEPWWLTLGWEQ